MQNGLSVDVEDYFQASVFAQKIKYSDWDNCPSRVVTNTQKIMEILAKNETKATFFVLGWIASRFPSLVKKIITEGHEIAIHGFSHQLISEQTPDQFLADLSRAKVEVEEIIGRQVVGYRAPSFSIQRATLWALEILRDLGFEYDSSVFPVGSKRNSLKDIPRRPFEIIPGLYEVPLPTIRIAAMAVPIAGGVFLRAFPYFFTRWAIRTINKEKIPVIVYIHPWELDPQQPRLCSVSFLNRIRHYINLHKTEKRLENLFKEFSFGPLCDIVKNVRDPDNKGLIMGQAPLFSNLIGGKKKKDNR